MDCNLPVALSTEFSRQEYGLGSHSILQGIFLIQGTNQDIPHCKQILYCLSHQGSTPGIIQFIGVFWLPESLHVLLHGQMPFIYQLALTPLQLMWVHIYFMAHVLRYLKQDSPHHSSLFKAKHMLILEYLLIDKFLTEWTKSDLWSGLKWYKFMVKFCKCIIYSSWWKLLDHIFAFQLSWLLEAQFKWALVKGLYNQAIPNLWIICKSILFDTNFLLWRCTHELEARCFISYAGSVLCGKLNSHKQDESP